MRFKNPTSNYTEEVDENAWLWVLLFGCFYFAFKEVWVHFIISALLAMMTCGLSWIIYPIFARDIMISYYRKRGWLEV
jgi:hypothetical protein